MEKKIQTIYDIIKKYDKIELTDRETQLGCDEINIIVDTLKDAISTLKTCVTEDKLNDIKQDLKDYISATVAAETSVAIEPLSAKIDANTTALSKLGETYLTAAVVSETEYDEWDAIVAAAN